MCLIDRTLDPIVSTISIFIFPLVRVFSCLLGLFISHLPVLNALSVHIVFMVTGV